SSRAAFLLPSSLPPILLSLLLLADQLSFAPTVLEARPQSVAFAAGQEAARFLAAQPGPFRVYSPSYSLPQQVAAQYGLAQADGVNPLQLADTAAVMSLATGVTPDPAAPYSVTLPPFPVTGDPATANAAALPNARALGLLNVGYVLSAFPLAAEGLAARGEVGGATLYHNDFARPRAWLAYRAAGGADRGGMLEAFARGELAVAGQGLDGAPGGFPVGLEKWSPDEIRLGVGAEAPGVVAVSGVA
ncbi:MAG: hypothetical protein HY784_02130, partial [Chloroflexi bacterium]|nr:hypothetical protein [Chloroflexota bacterium]